VPTALWCEWGIGSANLDEDVFVIADVFDVERRNVRDRLAFGTGAHVCPGAALARLEVVTAIEAPVATAGATISLVVDRPVVWNPVFWAHGPRSLWVELSE